MKIQCPNCSHDGTIPDDKIPLGGVTASCPKCKTKFQVTRPSPTPTHDFFCPKCGTGQPVSDVCIKCETSFATFLDNQINKVSDTKPKTDTPEPQSLESKENKRTDNVFDYHKKAYYFENTKTKLHYKLENPFWFVMIFGIWYFCYKRMIKHFIIYFIIFTIFSVAVKNSQDISAVGTILSWLFIRFIYAKCAYNIVYNHYLKKGWTEIDQSEYKDYDKNYKGYFGQFVPLQRSDSEK